MKELSKRRYRKMNLEESAEQLDDAEGKRTLLRWSSSYYVTTEVGETFPFWEFNLRFKTDSSEDGPAKGKPVLLSVGMMGDRAFIVFSAPEEISGMAGSCLVGLPGSSAGGRTRGRARACSSGLESTGRSRTSR